MNPLSFPQFLHHGAANGVTGSCHRYIARDNLHLLVDCGLFQGVEAGHSGTIDHRIRFDIDCVRALVVTHVHIDHIGRLPYLLAAGFQGPILCSVPSARLLPLVIEDALKMGFTRDRALIEEFLAKVQKQLLPVDYATWYTMLEEPCWSLKVRLQQAGHILGSAYVELELSTRDTPDSRWRHHRTVFSGDLGAPHAPLLPAPKSPVAADTLIIESTYGNRLHESRRERRMKLKTLVERALRDKGTVLIPAFSIGRTQELLYEFEGILHEVRGSGLGGGWRGGSGLAREQSDSESFAGKPAPTTPAPTKPTPTAESNAWADIAIIVDSPLAAKFTEVYRELKPFWDKEALQRVRAGRHPLDFDGLLTIDSHEDHERIVRYLAESGRPAIVIAASGMAAGGRIVNYLKAMLGDPRHNVLFVGYQASGTPGREILDAVGAGLVKGGLVGAGLPANSLTQAGSRASPLPQSSQIPQVTLDGTRYSIRAQVAMIGGYSAHADQANLLSFVRNMRRWPTQIRIVHGDDEARRALKAKFEEMAKQRGRALEVVLPVAQLL
jgi:metallo-beta-lactamase family protein